MSRHGAVSNLLSIPGTTPRLACHSVNLHHSPQYRLLRLHSRTVAYITPALFCSPSIPSPRRTPPKFTLPVASPCPIPTLLQQTAPPFPIQPLSHHSPLNLDPPTLMGNFPYHRLPLHFLQFRHSCCTS